MGVKQIYEAHVMRKISKKFVRQYAYAVEIIFVTFADTIDEQSDPASEENKKNKLLLKQAVAELLGSPNGFDNEYSKKEKALIANNRATIKRFEGEIMNSQPDIREFIVQTVRMLFFLDVASATNPGTFLKSVEGTALKKILEKYGGEFEEINSSAYDSICESVAEKTNTQTAYKRILKGKQP